MHDSSAGKESEPPGKPLYQYGMANKFGKQV